MTKYIKLILCLLLVGSVLAGCVGDFEPVAEPFVKEMMEALASGDTDTATALMHPTTVEQLEDVESSFQAMMDLVAGNQVVEMKRRSINISNYMGTNAAKKETGSFRMVMDDGAVMVAEYSYVENAAGAGFESFHLSVGT